MLLFFTNLKKQIVKHIRTYYLRCAKEYVDNCKGLDIYIPVRGRSSMN